MNTVFGSRKSVDRARAVRLSELVLAAFMRIVTHHRVYRDPTPPGVAVDFCHAVLTRRAQSRSGQVDDTGHLQCVVPRRRRARKYRSRRLLRGVGHRDGPTWVAADTGFCPISRPAVATVAVRASRLRIETAIGVQAVEDDVDAEVAEQTVPYAMSDTADALSPSNRQWHGRAGRPRRLAR